MKKNEDTDWMPDIKPIRFDDLEPIEVAVTVGETPYVLREASADAARKYRNRAVASAKMEDGKVVGMDGVADVEALLVSECLFIPHERNPKNRWQHVGEALVLSWPNRVVKALFERVKQISPELEEKETEDILQEQIRKLTERLEKLRGRKKNSNGEVESDPKDEPASTTDTSA